MPRSDTPCVVGCAAMLPVRRNRLKLATCRNASSAIKAGDNSIASLVTTLTLAGMSATRWAERVGVTVTVSSTAAGATTMSSSWLPVPTRSVFSANPPARTVSVTSPSGASIVKRPSGPVTVSRSGDPAVRTLTVAPTTAPPSESWTTPVSVDAPSHRRNAAVTRPSTVPGTYLVPTWHVPGTYLVGTWHVPGTHLSLSWHGKRRQRGI